MLRAALRFYLASQVVVFAAFAYAALPGHGREWANAHPWVRGGDGTREGADVGFDGYGPC